MLLPVLIMLLAVPKKNRLAYIIGQHMRIEPNSPSEDNVIEFIEIYKFNALKPVLARKMLPDWYKNQSPFYKINNFEDLTVKRCIPFLDAMTSGYFLVTTEDYYVKDNIITTNKYNNYFSKHPNEQFESMKFFHNFHKDVFKWHNQFLIKTPKNTSCMFIHPSNWLELPFFTLSGIVDTDSFINPVSFPFIIHKNFQGKIPKNTPIVQIIPFKREQLSIKLDTRPNSSLIQSHKNQSEDYESKRYDNERNPLGGMYKKEYWSPKEYD